MDAEDPFAQLKVKMLKQVTHTQVQQQTSTLNVENASDEISNVGTSTYSKKR